MLQAVMLSKPEVHPVQEPKQESKLKQAMVAEGSLIASHIGTFLASMGIAATGAVEIASGGNSWQENTILGLLIGAITFLVRQMLADRREYKEELQKRDDKMNLMWERLLKEKDENEMPDERARHGRRK